MMTNKNMVDLPDDLFEEILSRVPAVSLVRLRSTCKGWNALIKDERFVKKHFTSSPKQSLVILLIASRVYLASLDLHTTRNNKVKLSSPLSLKRLKYPVSKSSKEADDIYNIFHCDGLLLYTTKDNRLGVWNPCSSRDHIMWIQPRTSYKRFDIFALGKSSCNKYKILRIDQCNHTRPVSLEYEIYDFTSNSWRVLGKIQREFFIPRIKDRGMSVNGNTYWHASTNTISFLLSFDFSTERFARVSLPGDLVSCDQVIDLSVTREGEKLCMLATQSGNVKDDIDVWIATKIESTGAATWIKFISLCSACIKQPLRFCNGMHFFVDQVNKVLVCREKEVVFNTLLHVVGEGKSIRVDHHYAQSRCSLVMSYVPTLVQNFKSNKVEFLE